MIHKISMASEKENMQMNSSSPASTIQVRERIQEIEPRISKCEVGSFDKSVVFADQRMQAPSKSTKLSSTMSSSQEIQRMKKLVLKKEDMQINVRLPPSSDQAMKHSQTTEKGSSNPTKVKRVRGSNKCKEVASLENGEKLKITFYNNQTVGKNSNLFSRHLGKIIHNRNICPMGVSSWSEQPLR